MRGSPLFRTLLVLAVLALTGLGLARWTRPAPSPGHGDSAVSGSDGVAGDGSGASAAATTVTAHYRLLLSAPARAIELSAADRTYHEAEGQLQLDPALPAIFLKVAWASTAPAPSPGTHEAAPSHRFAKLTLEIPGQPTQTHVFEAPGDLDDVWEPEL